MRHPRLALAPLRAAARPLRFRPRRRRRPLGPGRRRSRGANRPRRGLLSPGGSTPARRLHRPPMPGRPPSPCRMPAAAWLRPGWAPPMVRGHRRRRTPRRSHARAPRSARPGPARRIRHPATRDQLPPNQLSPSQSSPDRALRDRRPRARLGPGQLSRRCHPGRHRRRLTRPLGRKRPVSGSRVTCWMSRSAWAVWQWCTGPPTNGSGGEWR